MRRLRYFMMAAEELNFSKAAIRLKIAQPALTRQIQQLEEYLGVKLFLRTPRGVSLTYEGNLLAEEAQILLNHVREICHRIRLSTTGEAGELNIGYAPSITGELLSPSLASLHKAAPRIDVKLHDLSGNELLSGLRNGRLDLCLMQRPRAEMSKELSFEPLRHYSLQVALNKGHALAKHKTISLAEIRAQVLIVYQKELYSDYHHLLERVFENGLSRALEIIECDGTNSVFAEIEADRGVCLLPEIMRSMIGSRFKLVPLTEARPPLEVGFCTSTKHGLSAAAKRFVSILRSMGT